MSHKITINNIYNFIEGNVRFFIKDSLAKHIKEQIAYRMLSCKNDCAKTGHCVVCRCDYPERIYATKSCNQSRFPNLMSGSEWKQFKKDNNIE